MWAAAGLPEAFDDAVGGRRRRRSAHHPTCPDNQDQQHQLTARKQDHLHAYRNTEAGFVLLGVLLAIEPPSRSGRERGLPRDLASASEVGAIPQIEGRPSADDLSHLIRPRVAGQAVGFVQPGGHDARRKARAYSSGPTSIVFSSSAQTKYSLFGNAANPVLSPGGSKIGRR